MSLLEVSDLTVEYASGGYLIRPIHEFNLSMERGELGILLGASGSGKSTLLSALAGLLRPAGGSIRVDGQEVVGLAGRALTLYRQRGVGVVFQAFNLIPSLSVRENIELVLLTAGYSGHHAHARSEELLGAVDLLAHTRKRPGQLSGGQQQRVSIARALALDPRMILADEPTAHLDYIQVEGVLNILRELADADRTVLVATHDDRLLPLADRVIELTPRKRRTGGPPERRELADGEVLFRQGDEGQLVYAVESGTIQLLREVANGPDEVITEVTSGRYFGELAPLFNLPRSATAKALGQAVVNGLPLDIFRDQMREQGTPVAGPWSAAVEAALLEEGAR
jgi:putative ABC transport system ATP-binding protein